MDPAAPHEIELKLEVDPASADRAAQLPAPPPAGAVQQISTYFDTEDRTLHARGISLRIRTSGDRRIQTVKAAANGSAGLFKRQEWEKPIATDLPDLEGLDDVLDGIASRMLRPVFTVDVTRTSWRIERAAGEVELVFDTGAIRADGESLPLCEFECELKAGDVAALFEVARELHRDLPLRIGVLAKSERGYRLGDGSLGRASKAEHVTLDAGMEAAEAFRTICSACIRHFRLNEPLVVGPRDAEALHQARVALRRLRSAFALFRNILADAEAQRLRQELRWISQELGRARDLDVLLGRLGKGADGALPQAREAAYDEVAEALASTRSRGLMIDLVAWLHSGTWLAPGDAAAVERLGTPIRPFAARLLRRYRKKVRRKGEDLATLTPEARHRVRIEVKKLRYASEFFAALATGKKEKRLLKTFVTTLEDMQTSLGSLNDIAFGTGIGSVPDEEPELHAEETDALLHEAADAHERFVDAKPFWKD